MPEIQDKILFERIKTSRDRQAYEILFKKWYPALWAHARHFVGDHDAENVVQDTMTTLWEKAASLTVRDNVAAYLHTAVKNRCLSLIYRGSVKDKIVTEMRVSILDAAVDADPCVRKELAEKLRGAMHNLPDAQREALEMSRFEKRTYSEIASQTGVSAKTVEYRVTQAIKKLREALAEFFVD